MRYSTYRYLDRVLGSEKEREFCYFPLVVPAYSPTKRYLPYLSLSFWVKVDTRNTHPRLSFFSTPTLSGTAREPSVSFTLPVFHFLSSEK